MQVDMSQIEEGWKNMKQTQTLTYLNLPRDDLPPVLKPQAHSLSTAPHHFSVILLRDPDEKTQRQEVLLSARMICQDSSQQETSSGRVL